MSYSNGVNMVRESARSTYLSLHDQKTDEELTAIVRYNCSAVLSMQDELAAAKLLGEAVGRRQATRRGCNFCPHGSPR